MKKSQLKYALLFLVLVVPAFTISCNKKEDEVKLDFDLTVPDNWDYAILANINWIYTAARNAVNDQDSIREGLVIYKEELPNWTLIQYYTAVRANLITKGFYDETLYVSDTVVNGTDFIKLISKETLGYVNTVYNDTIDVNVITERYFFYENSYGYNMAFNSVDTLYDENKIVFNQIISSFHYKE